MGRAEKARDVKLDFLSPPKIASLSADGALSSFVRNQHALPHSTSETGSDDEHAQFASLLAFTVFKVSQTYTVLYHNSNFDRFLNNHRKRNLEREGRR